MTLTFTGLDYLRLTAEAGSFAAAARAAGVSQPAVAQQVRRIEEEYGVRLFQRRHGRLEPTPLCEDICSSAERLVEERTSVERMLRRQSSVSEGEIAIGLGNMMPGMAVIARFNANFPSVRLRVESGSHERITRLVLTQHVDVGILPDVPADHRFRRERLCGNEVVALVPMGHPFGARPTLPLSDLAGERLIFRSRGSSTQRAVERMFRRSGGLPRPFLTLDTRDGVYEAVAQGLGVGFIWRNGTGRRDSVHRISIEGVASESEETAFALAESKSSLVDAFFAEIRAWRRPGPESTGPQSTGLQSAGPQSNGPQSTAPRYVGLPSDEPSAR